jgi:predicted kinase
MTTIHLIEGPVGAGKSTTAAGMSRELNIACLDLDDWMVTLFSPDRPDAGFMQWYGERKSRCLEQIWKVAERLLAVSDGVILELGLVQRADRAAFYQRVDESGHDLIVHLLDVPEETRLDRVRQRNQSRSGTFKMEVTDEIFEIANAAWQPPDEVEIELRDIRRIVQPSL